MIIVPLNQAFTAHGIAIYSLIAAFGAAHKIDGSRNKMFNINRLADRIMPSID
jgi:hypothetical protein